MFTPFLATSFHIILAQQFRAFPVENATFPAYFLGKLGQESKVKEKINE